MEQQILQLLAKYPQGLTKVEIAKEIFGPSADPKIVNADVNRLLENEVLTSSKKRPGHYLLPEVLKRRPSARRGNSFKGLGADDSDALLDLIYKYTIWPDADFHQLIANFPRPGCPEQIFEFYPRVVKLFTLRPGWKNRSKKKVFTSMTSEGDDVLGKAMLDLNPQQLTNEKSTGYDCGQIFGHALEFELSHSFFGNMVLLPSGLQSSMQADTEGWEIFSTDRVYEDWMQKANNSIAKAIFGITLNKFNKENDYDYCCCHIFARAMRAKKVHTVLANMVLVPHEIASLVAFSPTILEALKVTSYNLYGWLPSHLTKDNLPAPHREQDRFDQLARESMAKKEITLQRFRAIYTKAMAVHRRSYEKAFDARAPF